MAIDKRAGVYRIVCLPTGKVYIGSTKSFAKRWRIHRKALSKGIHHSVWLQRAWDRCGSYQFRFEVLEVVEDVSRLDEAEQKWLDKIRPYDRKIGFNACRKANSPNPRAGMPPARKPVRSEEEKWAARSAASKKKMSNPETREKMSILMSEIMNRPENKSRQSALMKARWEDPEWRAAFSVNRGGNGDRYPDLEWIEDRMKSQTLAEVAREIGKHPRALEIYVYRRRRQIGRPKRTEESWTHNCQQCIREYKTSRKWKDKTFCSLECRESACRQESGA